MEDKQVLTVEDIMKIFSCGRAKAYSIIRGIKAVSDIAGFSGTVTISDYLRWYWRGIPQKYWASSVIPVAEI